MHAPRRSGSTDRAVAQFAGLAAAYLHREGRGDLGRRELELARELANGDGVLQLRIDQGAAFNEALEGRVKLALRVLRQLPDQ